MSRKCSHCKKTYEDEELTKEGRSYYCNECYENHVVPNILDWNDLYEYIKEVNHLNKLPISVITLLKKYKSENNMTFYGQRLTYEFIKEIEQVPDNGENSGNYMIGLLPYYYDKASEFYGNLFELEEKEELEKQKELNISTYKDKQIKYKKKNLNFNLIWKEDEEDEDK